MHGRSSRRVSWYFFFTALVAAQFLLDVSQQGSGNFTLFYLFFCALCCVWVSYPRYKSKVLQWASCCLSVVIVGNVAAGAALGLLYGERTNFYPANLRVRLNVTAGKHPGISGSQLFTTDARGYRTNKPINYHLEKGNSLRIVTLGASTTADALLDDRKTWAYRMGQQVEEKAGKPVEVINIAIPGFRAEQSYQSLLIAEALKPDVITFILGINDWNRAIRLENYSLLEGYIFKWRSLRFTNSPVYRSLKYIHTLVGETLRAMDPTEEEVSVGGGTLAAAASSLDRREKRRYDKTSVDSEYAVWLDRILTRCQDQKITCIFGEQPTAYSLAIAPDLRNHLWMTPPDANYTLSLENLKEVAELYNQWTKDRVRHYDQTFCPLAYRMPPSTEVFYDDCHFNEEGARRIADMMAKCVLDKLDIDRF